MYNRYAFFGEDAIKIEIIDAKLTADFTGAVVLNTRPARAPAAVGHIDLVAIAPRPALLKLRTFIVHAAASQIVFNKVRHRTALDKGRQHFHRHSKIRRDTGHIAFGAGGLHLKGIAGVKRL